MERGRKENAQTFRGVSKSQPSFSSVIFASPHELRSPHGIAISTNGILYVSDHLDNNIHMFELNGRFIRRWGQFGIHAGHFRGPSALQLSAVNEIVRSVLCELNAVEALRTFPPGLLPICAAYVGQEHLYVCDTYNHRLQVFSCDGDFIREWGSFGPKDGQLVYPRGCAVNGEVGLVYVCDNGNGRVQVFNTQGGFIRHLMQDITHLSNVTIGAGIVHIIANETVHRVRPDGTPLERWIIGSVRALAVDEMSSVAYCTGRHTAYISWIYSPSYVAAYNVADGTLARKWQGHMVSARCMTLFHGILYMTDGNMNRIVSFNPQIDDRPDSH